ncbi:MAG: glucose ABC transporter permease GlcU [Methanomassiliicoccales archaeon]
MTENVEYKRSTVSPVIRAVILQLVILILIVIWLIPAYTMIINGFKSNTLIQSAEPTLVPPSIGTLLAFKEEWASLQGPIVNSMEVIIPVAVISTVFGSMAAYFFDMLSNSFSQRLRILSNAAFAVIALGTFMPYQATLMPLTRLMADLGGLETYWGLLFSFLIFYLPTGALLMSIFMSVVPARLSEAARLDGAGDLRIFFRVILPAVMPGFIATLIFIFIMSWNVFFIPLVLVTNPASQLVPVTVMSLTGGFATLYNETFATAVLASIVPLALFIFMGRYFIRGLMALGSGGKGL